MQSLSTFEKARAILELVVAASFWGFGFIATVWALEALDAFQLTFLRFAIAGGAGALFLLVARHKGAWRDNLRWTFWPAFFLAGTLIFQTWGMHYTTVAKSGFITTLYVIFVPILESAISGKRLGLGLWACVFAALVGTALIVGVGISELNLGDFLTLICAVLAALQIYIVGKVSPNVRQPFVFNIVQSCWAAVMCAPVIFLSPLHHKLMNVAHWPVGVLALAFGSTILAFYLQVRAQAKLSTTVSTLLFLLESPFALIFAMLILNQTLGFKESIGAVMIFLSAIGASLLEGRRKNTN
jgi:drug/metabolite transporter (DMT)-like permease